MIKALEAVADPVQAEKQEPGKDVSAETSKQVLRRIAPAVDSSTCVPHWEGEDCDYAMAVDALLQRDERLG